MLLNVTPGLENVAIFEMLAFTVVAFPDLSSQEDTSAPEAVKLPSPAISSPSNQSFKILVPSVVPIPEGPVCE